MKVIWYTIAIDENMKSAKALIMAANFVSFLTDSGGFQAGFRSLCQKIDFLSTSFCCSSPTFPEFGVWSIRVGRFDFFLFLDSLCVVYRSIMVQSDIAL